jgi:hypothetical protein
MSDPVNETAVAARVCVGDRERCCGRKPMSYRRDGHWFCDRCDAAYRMPTGEQIANWAWLRSGDGFTPRYPESEGAKLGMVAVDHTITGN